MYTSRFDWVQPLQRCRQHKFLHLLCPTLSTSLFLSLKTVCLPASHSSRLSSTFLSLPRFLLLLVFLSLACSSPIRARKFQEGLIARGYTDCGIAMLIKQRLRANEIESMDLVGSVAGSDVIIVDDMIDTAGTLCEAARELRKKGARRVFAFATHGLFSGPAIQRIEASPLEEVVVTDSIKVLLASLSLRLRLLSLLLLPLPFLPLVVLMRFSPPPPPLPRLLLLLLGGHRSGSSRAVTGAPLLPCVPASVLFFVAHPRVHVSACTDSCGASPCLLYGLSMGLRVVLLHVRSLRLMRGHKQQVCPCLHACESPPSPHVRGRGARLLCNLVGGSAFLFISAGYVLLGDLQTRARTFLAFLTSFVSHYAVCPVVAADVRCRYAVKCTYTLFFSSRSFVSTGVSSSFLLQRSQ